MVEIGRISLAMRIVLLVVIAAAAACGAPSATAPAPTPAAPLPWLDGDWAYADGSGTEHWVEVDGRRVGVSFVGDEQFDLMVVDFPEGGPRLAAMPAGAAAVEFTAAPVTSDALAISFANPAHDFPKTITYQRESDDRMVARLAPGDGPIYAMVPREPATAAGAETADRARARAPSWSRVSSAGNLAATAGRTETGSYVTIWRRDGGWTVAFEIAR